MLSFSHRCLFAAALAVVAFPAAAVAQQAIGQLYASDASVKGSVVLAGSGTSVLSGSSIEAGTQSAMLKLERGGSVLVCEGTKLSITSSRTGRELLLSLNSGNLELNYLLGTEADTLLTPDLRLLLPGPGTVHVAVRITPQGDTCVQPLPQNASAIVISESMGDATYQVKPDEPVIFKQGHLNQASRTRENCGCPAPPTQVAKPAPAPPISMQPKPAASTAAAAPAPPDQHLAVEAPFIFRGSDPIPDLSETIAVLRLESNPVVPLEPTVIPPSSGKRKSAASNNAQTARKQRHGLFGKVAAFFATIFR
jgi:hypothetical protein